MKLLAPNVGWAVTTPRLLWTVSGGTSWKEITPPVPKDALIGGVFFLDTRRGWVLLKHGEPDVPGGLEFDLASTSDAGATWSEGPLGIPESAKGSLFNGGSWIAFADPDHGWIALATGLTPISRGSGGVFATSDGGRTWVSPSAPDPHHRLSNTDMAGPIVMVTPQFGWIVGGPVSNELYVTRDGAKSWQTVELESPVKNDQMRQYDRNVEEFERGFRRAVPPAGEQAGNSETPEHQSWATYHLPIFDNPNHGYIPVGYPSAAVLFATDDGGVSWKPEKVVEGRPPGPSAVVNSTWITVKVPRNGSPSLVKVAPQTAAEMGAGSGPEDLAAHEISFVTANQGWVETLEGHLFSTSDGGASWTDITPARIKPQ